MTKSDDDTSATWPAPIDLDDEREQADLIPSRPPDGFTAVTHGLSTGVYCCRQPSNRISLAITFTVFNELGWPFRSPYTHVPISFWLDSSAGTLAVIWDRMGDSLWRSASNSFSEALYSNEELPFAHPVLDRLPEVLTLAPHVARDGVLYLDIASIFES